MTNDLVMRLKELELQLLAEGSGAIELPDSELGLVAELRRKIGQQQMRGAQVHESALEQLRGELQLCRRQCDELVERAHDDRLRVLEWMDALDDVLRLARQSGDARLVGWLDRLVKRGLETLAFLGVEETPSEGQVFDETVHEAIDVVPLDGRQSGEIVEVVRRGFLRDGRLLRRTQVTVAREVRL